MLDSTVGVPRGSKRSPNAQLEPGTLLNGRYQIVRRVGGGGMGNVYMARDKRLADALRAVKEMIEMFSDEAMRRKAIEDFERESQILASLEHPSIPTIYDYFIADGRYYLVMKYIGGGDLAGRLRASPNRCIDEKTVTEWSIQVCDVLDFLHSQRPPIIYRDLKPANLMIDDRTNRVMLIDFGIARCVSPTQKGVTAIGTMGYAPPELFSGKVEPRSDIYSLGATMFHLLTGSDPQDNPLLIFDFSKYPRPRQINPSISPKMDEIICKAVEHKPERRFSSALEMKRVLEEHLKFLERGADRRVGSGTVGLSSGQVFCGNCGLKIAAEDLFCVHCGARQPIQSAPEVAKVIARLVLVQGNGPGASFILDKDTNIIGRVDPHTGIFPEIDLSSHDPETKVSRRHAKIYREGGQFLVEDLSSVNGTLINNFKLYPRQPRVLQNGDELRLGETVLKFIVG
ncbi:MAG: protein kinase [Acidobacteriota bacterium]|nr:protein kinase [Blastocatellia bacterium]MDW8413706.1 protein kinase [Acidobacteriota bacterium]